MPRRLPSDDLAAATSSMREFCSSATGPRYAEELPPFKHPSRPVRISPHPRNPTSSLPIKLHLFAPVSSQGELLFRSEGSSRRTGRRSMCSLPSRGSSGTINVPPASRGSMVIRSGTMHVQAEAIVTAAVAFSKVR